MADYSDNSLHTQATSIGRELEIVYREMKKPAIGHRWFWVDEYFKSR
ncbi:hypothetical protein [Vibrio sp. CK2-1]|nr:hypothetical protein [Vibrio sp. CK2-1]MCF7354201.1 hypothetical protein [Vibrio sp. CK2-1]